MGQLDMFYLCPQCMSIGRGEYVGDCPEILFYWSFCPFTEISISDIDIDYRYSIAISDMHSEYRYLQPISDIDMPVIAVAATKGGTGKSSLIANLSVRASADKSVAILDYDPQLSLVRWHELRGKPNNPAALEGTSRGARVDVGRLVSAVDWVFLDLPPATQHLIREGIRAADLVVVPVKTSPLDLEAIEPILELCDHHKKPFAFVLSMYDPKWKLAETAFAYLEKVAPGCVLREVFGYRQAYVGSMIGGGTGPEYNQDAKQARACEVEIDALWKAVERLAHGK